MENPPQIDAVLKDKALENIYTSCDIENQNSVPVGVLINYVRPYMEQNTSELRELEAALDPNDTNPCVTSEEFYRGMSEWALKVNRSAVGFVNESSLQESHPSDSFLLNGMDFPFVQSTPRARCGQLLKECEGGANLNISNVSAYSITECNLPSLMDPVFLEEKIKELEHQLNKCNSENLLLRQQLVSTEEQNEALQCELTKVKKRFLSAQQMLETLQKHKKESDDFKEELIEARKEIEYLKNNYSASEKKVQNLNLWIKQLEEDKLLYNQKSEKNVESTQSLKRTVCDLQDELVSKCGEIEDLESQITRLREELSEKVDGNEHLTKTNDLLKQENISLRTNWRKYISTKNDSVFDQFETVPPSRPVEAKPSPTATSQVSPDNRESSPANVSSQLSTLYYSPEFRNQIEHPVTPCADSPMLNSCSTTSKSVAIDEISPIAHPKNKENLLKNVLMKHTSTPEAAQTGQRTLLDSSLPCDSRKLAVMDFTTQPLQTDKDPSKSDIDTQAGPNDRSDTSKRLACDTSINEAGDGSSGRQIVFQSLNVSSDEDVYYKMSAASIENSLMPGESLQDEISNATKHVNIDEVMDKLKEHENCHEKIESYETEIGDLKMKLSELDKMHQEKYSQLLTENETQLRQLKEELTLKEQEISNLQNIILNKDKEIKTLMADAKTDGEIKNTLWRDIQELKAESCVKDTKVSKCCELEKKLQVLEKNYSILKEKCTNFEVANGKLQGTYTELEIVHKDQKEQLNKLSQEITIYENDIKKCKAIENKQAKEIECMNHTLVKAQEDNQKLIDKLGRLQGQVKNLNEKVSELENENEVFRSLLQEQERKRIDYKKDLESVGAHLNEKLEDMNRLQTSYNVLTDQLSELRTYNKKAKIDQQLLRQENDSLISKVNTEREKCELIENQLVEFEKYLGKIITKKELNLKLRRVSDSDHDHNAIKMASQIEKIISDFISENEASKQTIHSLKLESEMMRNNLQASDQSMSEKLQQLLKEKCKTEESYNKLNIDYKGILVKYDHKQKKLTASNSKLKTVKKNYCQLQHKCKKITGENVVLSKENITMSEQITQSRETIEKLIITNQAINVAHEKLSQELSDMEDRYKKQKVIYLEAEGSLKKQLQNEELKNMNLRKTLIKVDDETAKLKKQCDNLKQQQELRQTELSILNSNLMKVRNSMMASRKNLTSSTDLAITNFKHVLDTQQGGIFNTMSDFKETEYNMTSSSAQIETLIDEEIAKLNNQIYATSKLLEYLALMNSKSTEDVEVQTEVTDYTSVCVNTEQKPLNKFTLHQSKQLSSCPASPDSPSVMEQLKFQNSSQNAVEEWQELLLDLESMESTEGEILNDDNKFQAAFPNQPDTFLESIGLHEDSPRKTHSKLEMEEKFTALVLTWTLDRDSVKERYQTQQNLYQQYRKQIVQLMTQIVVLLKEHKCSEASGTILPAIEHLELIREYLDKGFTAAGQCGTLRYEIRHNKYWNLVVNYVASLKQEIDATQLLCLSTTESSPKLCPENVNDDTPTKAGGLRNRKLVCAKQLQVTMNSENFSCFKEDSSLPSVFFCNSLKSILFIVMLFSFVALGFMMYVQWQCSRSAYKKPICPLEYVSKLFIKRVHIGMPPM